MAAFGVSEMIAWMREVTTVAVEDEKPYSLRTVRELRGLPHNLYETK